MKYFFQTLHSLVSRSELSQLLKGCNPLNKAILFFALTFIGFLQQGIANNIAVSNTTLTGRNTSAGVNNAANYSMIQFDLSWSNSWRSGTTNNWDAAWVFVKFRLGAADYLSTAGATNSGTTITVNTTNGLRVGMPVFVNSGTGAFASGTVITAINSATTFTVSASLTTSLSSSAVVRAERIWEHCWLNNTGHNKGSIGSSGSLQVGLQDETVAFNANTNPALGAYFYRSANGAGTFASTGAQLQWNYGANGIKDNDIVDIQVFATEMVNVPTATYNIDTAQHLANTVLLIDGDGINGAQNNTFLDGSTNNFTITRNGNTTQGTFSPFCGSGGSGYFDGSGDYLSRPNDASYYFNTGNYTIEAWVNPSDLTAERPIVTKAFNGSANFGDMDWNLSCVSGQVRFRAYTTTSYFQVLSSTTLPLNTWTHIAVVRSNNVITIYINGTSTATSSIGSSNNWSGNTLMIGGLNAGGFFYWKGYISNVRLVNGTAVYTSNFTVPTSPLTAITNTSLLLNFDNGSIDDTRRKNNIETIGNANINTTTVKYGSGSIRFDKPWTNDYLTTSGGDLTIGTGDFTIEFWAYPRNTSGGTEMRMLQGSSAVGGFVLDGTAGNIQLVQGKTVNSMNSPGDLLASISGSPVGGGAGGVLSANSWAHIALTRFNGTVRLFVNGNQHGSAVSNTTNITSQYFVIGGGIRAILSFDGFIDDFRMIKGVAIYTANFTPPTSAHSITSAGTYPISSENALTLGGTTAANLKYNVSNASTANDFNRSTSQTLGASFPKGYNGFYTMKYELSQQQWVDFFNSLTTVQKTARDITSATGKNSDAISYRNNISWSSGDATLNSSTHGNVACNWLNWPDAAAYADWSGLRPMTELEFEKAARGTRTPAVGEPASGSTCGGGPNLIAATGISNSGAVNETASNINATAVYNNQASVQGPLRSGALATSTSTRTTAGAGFYGIMDMSCNVTEQVVSIGNSTGRSFTGSHGNGALNTVGNADISTWPGYVTNANTGATGSGKRGGSWEDISDRLLISDRFQANTAITTRDRNTGFRAARNQPSTPAQ